MASLLGCLLLADRANDGVISAAFHRESSDARDAAETGMPSGEGPLRNGQPTEACPSGELTAI